MPPTGRRRARKDDSTTVEAQTPEVVTTPSRKRRRLNGTDTKPPKPALVSRASVESDETVEENGDLSDTDIVDEVIRHLRVANYKVNAVDDYNNSIVDPTARAFAKVAGQSWTYYVTETSVVIGRPNKPKRESAVDSDHPVEDSEYKIDIDLGPDMQVSRFHAKIEFDGDAEEWMVIVNGRNGLILDDRRLERGQKAWLRSGMVINILGTQMMFLLPQVKPEVHPEIKKMLLAEEDQGSEEYLGEEKAPRSQNRGPRGRQSNVGPTGRGGHPAGAASTTRASQQTLAIANSQQLPGTPVHSSKESTQPKSSTKQSPTYTRGLVLENNDDIDYGAESAKDIKPPLSYAAMIGQAILSTPEENATLARIYEFIKEKYAFYRFNGGGWQNSIRHNLSLSKNFEKIPRRTDEPGKGMKWQIVPEFREEFLKKSIVPAGKKLPRRLDTSGPNSPAGPINPAAQTERLQNILDAADRRNSHTEHDSPHSITPPLVKFITAESYTPDRGSRPHLTTANLPSMNGGAISASSTELTPGRPPVFSTGSGPTHDDSGLTDAAVHSPPTLSGTMYERSNLFTPLVTRQKPLLAAQPSTTKLPSHYVKELFSSPAPFWKYVDMGSTPARPALSYDISPAKTDPDGDEEMADADSKADDKKDSMSTAPPVQPSSPPQLIDTTGASSGGEGTDPSPSRTLSRPASRREITKVSGLGQVPNLQPGPRQPMLGLPSNAIHGLGPALNPYAQVTRDDDDADDEPIDLAKSVNLLKLSET